MRSMCVEPQSTLMLKPLGELLMMWTSAPSASNTGLATLEAAPLAQSRPTFTPCSEKLALAMRLAM